MVFKYLQNFLSFFLTFLQIPLPSGSEEVSGHFWCIAMADDVFKFVDACSVYINSLHLTTSNTSNLSKLVHFIPVPKFLFAREMAWVVVDHIFWIHGFPENVVSDKEPQFLSHIWRGFCLQIGTTASISSVFKPQTNHANQDLK